MSTTEYERFFLLFCRMRTYFSLFGITADFYVNIVRDEKGLALQKNNLARAAQFFLAAPPSAHRRRGVEDIFRGKGAPAAAD